MKTPTHRITYITPKGRVLSNRTIEAPTRAEAESEFKKDFPKMEVINV